jgi:ankyrin repeat protein
MLAAGSVAAGPAEDLIAAAHRGDAASVHALLDKGADANAKDSNAQTALMYAVDNGNGEVISALLAKGADVNARAQDGETALMAASFAGRRDAVQLLLDKGTCGMNIKAHEPRS